MHSGNNNDMNNDKLFKLCPLINKFIEYFVPSEFLNYDESMIKYFERHSLKQFMRGKPIRFGFKAWCLNSLNGYLINFDIYIKVKIYFLLMMLINILEN